ncbi:unnamed protein product, partial [Clonostachys rhizophaga]
MVFRGQLCRTCSGLDFDKDHLPFGKNMLAESDYFEFKKPLKLGPLGGVRVRGCPLCKLVTFATLEIQRTENFVLDDSNEVELLWLPSERCGIFGFSFTPGRISMGTVLSSVQLKSEPAHACLSGLYMPLKQSQIDFGKAWDLIPKTIQDAITTTQLVGERYLWVDSLCLMQNDPKDLRHGTNVMDLMYEQPILCIVAACRGLAREAVGRHRQ